MLTSMEKSIMKEMDNQRLQADSMSLVLDLLTEEDQQSKLLDYLIDNRNTLITQVELFEKVRELCN